MKYDKYGYRDDYTERKLAEARADKAEDRLALVGSVAKLVRAGALTDAQGWEALEKLGAI